MCNCYYDELTDPFNLVVSKLFAPAPLCFGSVCLCIFRNDLDTDCISLYPEARPLYLPSRTKFDKKRRNLFDQKRSRFRPRRSRQFQLPIWCLARTHRRPRNRAMNEVQTVRLHGQLRAGKCRQVDPRICKLETSPPTQVRSLNVVVLCRNRYQKVMGG